MAGDEIVQVVVAILANESAAVGALAGLKHWDEQRKDIELGSIATLKIVDGRLQTDIERKKGKSPWISGVIGLIKGVLGPYLMIGSVVGGVAHKFLQESEDLTPQELEQLGKDMENGSVAMLVVCRDGQGEPTSLQLAAMGGRVQIIDIPTAVIEAANAVLQEAAAKADAEAEAAEEAAKAAKEAEKAAKKAGKDAEKAAKEAQKAAEKDA